MATVASLAWARLQRRAREQRLQRLLGIVRRVAVLPCQAPRPCEEPITSASCVSCWAWEALKLDKATPNPSQQERPS